MVPSHTRVSVPAEKAMEPAGRTLEPAERDRRRAGRALKPAGRASEPAGRPRGEGGTGGRMEKMEKICGDAIGHRPLRDRCPKSKMI